MLRRMTNVCIDKLLPYILKPMYRYAEKDDKRIIDKLLPCISKPMYRYAEKKDERMYRYISVSQQQHWQQRWKQQ